jgi:hypothetical protein
VHRVETSYLFCPAFFSRHSLFFSGSAPYAYRMTESMNNIFWSKFAKFYHFFLGFLTAMPTSCTTGTVLNSLVLQDERDRLSKSNFVRTIAVKRVCQGALLTGQTLATRLARFTIVLDWLAILNVTRITPRNAHYKKRTWRS